MIHLLQAKSIKEATEKALWFLETFGLKIEKLGLRSTTTNERVELNFSHTDASDAPGDEPRNEDPENTLLMEILFLLECFDVSDEFYHELSMIVPNLPRSYKVKRLRSNISKSVDITRLPEPAYGAYRPVAEYLESLICDQVSLCATYFICHLIAVWRGGTSHCTGKVQWRWSQVFKHFQLCSAKLFIPKRCRRCFSWIRLLFCQHTPNVTSLVIGNHTFAAVKASEDYMSLRDSLKPVFEELNSLLKEKRIKVHGKTVNLNIIFGSDLKVN